MVALNHKTLTPHGLAKQLLVEQEVIERFLESVRELEARVLAYEQQFGIPSSEVHEAIDSGRLQETLEVCNWLIDIEVLEWNKTGDR
jgi:hypothetical protein